MLLWCLKSGKRHVILLKQGVQSHNNTTLTWLPHFDYVHRAHSANVSEQNSIISQDETNTLFSEFDCI